jgi:hypothetical protein
MQDVEEGSLAVTDVIFNKMLGLIDVHSIA